MAFQTDIAIIGDGLAGLSLAKSLAHLPLKITLVAAKPKNSAITTYQSLALNWISHNILQALAIWPDLAADACPIRKIHISAKGRFQKTQLNASEFNLPALGYVIPTKQLEVVLHQKLAEQANLQVFYEHHLENLIEHVDDFELHLKTPKESVNLKTSFLIAADGVNSRVRQLLNIETERNEFTFLALLALVETQKKLENTAYERFINSETLAMLPRVDGAAGLVLTAASSVAKKYSTLSKTEFQQLIQDKFGFFLGKIDLLTEVQTHQFQPLTAKEQIKPGLVLLGNAAHQISPIAAQGFNLSLRDIAHLAESLTQMTLAGRINKQCLLENYLKLCQADQEKILRMTGLIESQAHFAKISPLLQEIIFSGLNLSRFLRRSFMKPMLGMASAPAPLLAGIPYEKL